MKKLNFNSLVKVKLTPLGVDIYYHRHDEFVKTYPKLSDVMKPTMPKIDKNGFTEFQLWHFMQLYGCYMGVGFKNVVEDISFYISEEDLENLKV